MAGKPGKYTSMRAPIDVNKMINVLAKMDGLSVQDWNDTRMRAWVEKLYTSRVKCKPTATAKS